MTWWRIRRPAPNRFDTGFESEGIVPLAYIVFAAALVIALGAVLRRTAPAIGLALIGFIVARVVVGGFLRPHYLSPLSATWSGDPGTTGPTSATAWLIRQDLSDAHGNAVQNLPSIVDACGGDLAAKFGDASCLAQHGVFNHAVYHPASRFWLFQGIEAAIFLGLALALGAFAVWWIPTASAERREHSRDAAQRAGRRGGRARARACRPRRRSRRRPRQGRRARRPGRRTRRRRCRGRSAGGRATWSGGIERAAAAVHDLAPAPGGPPAPVLKGRVEQPLQTQRRAVGALVGTDRHLPLDELLSGRRERGVLGAVALDPAGALEVRDDPRIAAALA